MAFQPIVDLALSRIDGYEALVRGLHGEGAGHVLSQVTADNLYRFDQDCRVRAIELATSYGLDRRLNINFLPNAVYEPSACIRATLDAAARTRLSLDSLTFEIVENEEISDTQHLRSIISEYRRHGFLVALDDFGTGYSSLVRLADLRPDIIKLDRRLVKGCDQDPTRYAILESLFALSDRLGIKVVAEGVENEMEALAVRRAGGRFMQGFFFGKPQVGALTSDLAITWPGVPVPA